MIELRTFACLTALGALLTVVAVVGILGVAEGTVTIGIVLIALGSALAMAGSSFIWYFVTARSEEDR
jgi:hypothetical protein